jgi:ankyrin repeat protein
VPELLALGIIANHHKINRAMKSRFIVIVIFATAITSLAGLTQETNRPARLIRIDMRAMQMQMAVLKDQDIHKVEELLKQGVDINAPIGCGTFSPLDGAVSTENMEMLKFLLAHGAKPQGRELADAAFYNNPDTALNFVKVLLSAGVNPNATNNFSSALPLAAYQGNRDVIVLLLAQPHIKIDAQDVDGYTALMWAADHGSLDIVDLLVNAGANPDLRNRRGETAATLAEKGIATRQAIISKLQTNPK